MPATIIRFYSEDKIKNDIVGLLGSSLGVVGIAILICLLLLVQFPVLFFFKTVIQTPFTVKMLIALPAIAECLTLVAMSVFRAQDQAAKFTLIAVCSSLFLIFFTWLLLPVLDQKLSGALIARGFAYGSIGLTMTYSLLRYNSLEFSIEKARAVFSFGFPLTFAAFGWFVLLSSDRYFLAYFSGMQQVGIYTLGCKLTILLLVLVVWPFELTYGPFIFSNMDHQTIRKMMSRLLTYLILSLIVVSYLIAFCSRDIIRIIAPNRYDSAYIVTISMLPATALQGIYYWSNAQLHITKMTTHIASIVGVAALFNLILDYLLIPKYGWLGAVLATSTSSLIAVGSTVVIGFFAFPVTLELRRLTILTGLGVILCFCCLITNAARPNYFYIANICVLFAIPGFLCCLGFFDSHEKQFFLNLFTFNRRLR